MLVQQSSITFIKLHCLACPEALSPLGLIAKMPYKSVKQEHFFNANKKKLEAQGVDVDEWNKASKGKKLPLKAPKSKPEKY